MTGNALHTLVARQLADLERRTSLRSFIAATPGYTSPEHLGPYLDLLERSRREPVRVVVAAPPRHGKSESTLHYVVQSLLIDPTDRIGYATYAAEFSEQQAKRAAIIAEIHGVQFAEQRASFWRTKQGGEVLWTSIGGPLTGKGVKRIFIDDPVKGRAEADSPAYREAAWAWFNAVAFTRLEPGGSVVVMATRWHPDDLSGRLIAQGWQVVNLPALAPDGKALWPARYSAEALHAIREQIGEYDWSSLYQGEPRAKGGRVFGEPSWCTTASVPEHGVRISLGADFAYSSKTYADYSVSVALVARPEHCIKRGNITRYYVADVRRQQVEAPAFRRAITEQRQKWPGKVTAYIAGTEKGVVDFLKQDGIPLEPLPATLDKFARAQPVAAAWNAGDVMVPKDAPWAEAFVSEVAAFTGVGDRHDDQVDALAGAFAPFAGPPKRRTETTNYGFG